MTFTLAELAGRVGGEVCGEVGLEIGGVATLEEAGPSDLSFLSNKKYRRAFEETRAAAVVVGAEEEVPPGRTVLRARNAQLAFARIITLFHPPPAAVPAVSEHAYVDPTARVDPSAEIMPLAYVGAEAVVGARSILHPGVYVGPRARIGEDCVLWPNVVVRERCTVGDRVILQPGCVVGSDGFGFVFDPAGAEGSGPRHYKIPQVGIAVVEDDVELGANTCVDRAALGTTVVGRGVKVDNLVQIAHNVHVGDLSILCAQVGIAGSTRLGKGVIAAGQVGIVGHITIHDGAKLGAQSGIMNDVEPNAVVFGYPARPKGEALRAEAMIARLPELTRKVKELERKLEELLSRT